MGRNKIKPEDKRVNFLITVSQETRDILRNHPRPAGRVIEEALYNKWIDVYDLADIKKAFIKYYHSGWTVSLGENLTQKQDDEREFNDLLIHLENS